MTANNILDILEIACDESGNDGENLLSGGSTVFAHASVSLTEDAAAALMEEVRVRTDSEAVELKSKTILQPRHQRTAEWLLSQTSIANNAAIHLTHKKYFVVAKLFDSTAEELAHELGHDIYETGVALAGASLLFFIAPMNYGNAWDKLLMEFQCFMRAKDSKQAQERLADLIESMVQLLSDKDAAVRNILGTVFAGLKHLGTLSRLQLGDGLEERLRTMDPLISAVGAAVHHWASVSSKPVLIVHDAAKELTPVKIEWAKRSLAHPENIAPSRQGLASELTDVRLVDSKEDSRVQVADLLAGIGRVVGESLVKGQQHPLSASLLPMISGASLWPIPANMNIETARQAMLSQF